MIVLSLVLVIAAAVCLFIGLFISTGLEFIFAAIALCLVSLLLLWLGTRAQRKEGPTEPSPAVYGGPARAGATAAAGRGAPAVRASDAADEDLDALTSPAGGEVVRKATARDRAAARVQEVAAPGEVAGEPDEATAPADIARKATAKKSTAKKATARKSTAKKATARKSTAKKSTAKKSTAKKATARKSTAKKSTAKKSTAKTSSTRRTTGAAARARLEGISGVGPAKQDALLARYGSIEAIRDASVDDITENVSGFGEALASRVKDALS